MALSNAVGLRVLRVLREPLCGPSGVSKAVIVLYVAINAIVCWNAMRHDPLSGYDMDRFGHPRYLQVLSEGRLPSRTDTHEFFTPPLSYALPAAALALGTVDLFGAMKTAQLLHVLYSLILTWFLLKLCDALRPACASLKVSALLLLGMLPVYYKSFAFVRPEPLLAMLAVVALYLTATLAVRDDRHLGWAVGLGVVWGLLILTRQWGFMVIGACLVFLSLVAMRRARQRVRLVAAALIGCVVATALGGWFYLGLHHRYGSVAAFNLTPKSRLAWSNRPTAFYTELPLRALFTDPVRPSFDARLLPQFYSETWGDYLGYFSVYGQDVRTGRYLRGVDVEYHFAHPPRPEWLRTNRQTIAGYLGRVNLLALLPSFIMMIGVIAGVGSAGRLIMGNATDVRSLVCALLGWTVIVSAAGYLWFLLSYQHPTSPESMIKATYVLHAFPVMALLAAETLQRLRQRSRGGYHAVLVGLSLAALYILPACVTRHRISQAHLDGLRIFDRLANVRHSAWRTSVVS